MHPKIEQVIAQSKVFSNLWTDFYSHWISAGLPIHERFTKLTESTMDEFSKRVITGLELLVAFEKSDDPAELLIIHRADGLLKQISAAQGGLNSILKQLKARPGAEFKITPPALETLKVFVEGNHTDNISIATDFDHVSSGISGVIDIALLGLKTRRVRAIGQFSDAANELLKSVADSKVQRDSIVKLAQEANSAFAEIQGARTDAHRLLSQVEEAATATENSKETVAELQVEAEAKLAIVREVAKAAGTLEVQVNGYETSFEGFQRSLDARVAQHESFEKSMESALIKNNTNEKEIDRLILKANDMIKGATTAGLGHSLEETRKVYETKMNDARSSFKWSIGFLVVSAIPLAIHLFPGLFGTWIGARPALSPGEVFNSGAALELLGKMFLLFPATWVTNFFSKAYAEYFHLEREYAHKAALARAVEGFKKQAPKYEEEITTAVFLEVQANPSKQTPPEAAEHPLLGPVLKKFMDALPLPGKSAKAEPDKKED